MLLFLNRPVVLEVDWTNDKLYEISKLFGCYVVQFALLFLFVCLLFFGGGGKRSEDTVNSFSFLIVDNL